MKYLKQIYYNKFVNPFWLFCINNYDFHFTINKISINSIHKTKIKNKFKLKKSIIKINNKSRWKRTSINIKFKMQDLYLIEILDCM